jgi:PAS domain S-box-containing protein
MATVLVVDDRATNRELVRTLLGYQGHHVIEAHEGAEALDLAHAQHPDLVVTDMLMPGMDGYELARELRAAPDTATTPIVFYTGNYQESEIRPFADAIGAARVLLRSSEPQELMRTVDEVLAEGPGHVNPIDTAQVDREHLRAVTAKLFQKAKALSDTETRFRLMADASPVGIAFGDPHGSANYINARLCEITGLPADDLLGLGWLHCAGDEHRDEVLTVARGDGPLDVQHRYRSHIGLRDHTARWLNVHVQAVQDDGVHVGFISTVDDVTTLVEGDQQRHATQRQHDLDDRDRARERLGSLSALAGGVAHDFNNILGSILAFENFVTESITDLTVAGRLDTDTSAAILKDLGQIRKGGERATGLTQQLLTFGARKVINLSAMDLNRAVRESNALLAPTLGAHIHIVTHLAEDLRLVLAEPTNMAQILLNLTVNAGHAMPDGGTLTIITSNVEITDEPHEPGPTPPAAGHYVRLTVRDTGEGMTPETLQRAIEPFFTTKGRGLGSGFGLAIVYGIVNQLGGVLRIESEPGHGAVFTIYLPTTDQHADTPPAPSTPAGGTETILIAEDDDGIRETLIRTLTDAGYTTLAAANGTDALALAEQHASAVDLLLTDVVMPGMLGDELAETLHDQRPDTRILFISGYAGDLMSRYGVLKPGLTVLAKPFTTGDLLTAVRTAIGTTTTTT